MALTFLRRLRDDHLSQRSIVELLNKKLGGKRPARSHKTVHVSNLTDDHGFCPRQFALLDHLNLKLPDEYVNAAMQVAFDTGESLHDMMRNKWLRYDVIGCWRCLRCKEVRHFSKLPPNSKGTDGHWHEWEYEEENFVDPETKVSGSIDFFIDLGNGKLTIVEVKTLDKDQFGVLAGPIASHRIRTQMYLALIDRSAAKNIKDQIDLTHGRIIYISKGYGKKNTELERAAIIPFKEFIVTRNDAAVAPYFAKGKVIQLFREGGPMPALICESHQDKKAKHCVACKACFSGKYPAGKKV